MLSGNFVGLEISLKHVFDFLALERVAALFAHLFDDFLLIEVLSIPRLPIFTLKLLVLVIFFRYIIIYSNESAPFSLWKVCKVDN